MIGHLSKLLRSERGAGVVEFALIAPAFFAMIVAVANFGILFFAHSGLKSAVAEGARFATIYPRPTDDEIKARITDRRFGMDAANITAATVTACTVDSRPCLDISMRYRVKLNFVFFQSSWSTQDLVETRRVFVY